MTVVYVCVHVCVSCVFHCCLCFPPQLIEDLRRELEYLQLFKLETEKPGRGRLSSSSLSEFNAKTREMELEYEIKRLKQVGPATDRAERTGPGLADRTDI